jgi:thioredoxin-like negative regulator of GroEL
VTASSQQPAARAGAKPSLIFFQSKASGRCRRVEGFLAQVLQRRSNHDTFEIVRVDADKQADLVAQFRIETIPTLVIVTEKRAQAWLSNPRGCRDIEEFLAPWLH